MVLRFGKPRGVEKVARRIVDARGRKKLSDLFGTKMASCPNKKINKLNSGKYASTWIREINYQSNKEWRLLTIS